MEDTPRLIEHAFPLKQASLDSVHEKNVRHGHISTLHIWPARRPLAACRAALIATLLPDPSTQPKPDGMSDEEWHKEIVRQRQELCEKIGGRIVKKIEKKRMPNGQVVEREKEVTEGGILHWGQETENAADLEWFRQEIRKAYGGRAPKVLDPFAGGGAIPLEAMRLGCEATAVDINPVAWFILKCTLEYPQKLAGKTQPLPEFILENEEFMEAFYKAHPHLAGRTKWTKRQTKKFGDDLFLREREVSYRAPQADLAWHVRAWGQWVLDRARRELAKYYPTYADFEKVGRVGQAVGQASRLPNQSAATEKLAGKDETHTTETVAPPPPLFFNPHEPLDIRQRRLPHWSQPGVLYFVTFRLADSIPAEKLEFWRQQREEWLRRHPDPVSDEDRNEYYRLFSDEMERWLDAGEGSCLLKNPQCREIVANALRHFDGTRYDLGAWCVMPNHVHVLVRPRESHTLQDVLHSWKSFTAHEINKALNRSGEVWQHESYDHIVRNLKSLWWIEEYILNNPVKAGLGHDQASLPNLSELRVSSFGISENRFATETVAPPLRRLVPLNEDGTLDVDALNAEFSEQYLADKHNPRWVAKATVAYLWARTVTCKNCRATVPLLKTLWLCKKDKKRVLLTMESNVDNTGVVFGIEANVPVKGGNAAQRREHDKRVGAGTMSRSGAKCPCCPAIMTMEDIRLEGQAGRLGAVNTAVVMDGENGKEYRLPTGHEIQMAEEAQKATSELFGQIPFGLPNEPLPSKEALGFRVPLYGFDSWDKLFTPRQLLALGTFVKWTRAAKEELVKHAYAAGWAEAIVANLACVTDFIVNRNSLLCTWTLSRETTRGTFARFALPFTWDFAEACVLEYGSGSYSGALDWIARYVEHALLLAERSPVPIVERCSAVVLLDQTFDCVVTDPPYYDAIPYSDLMDYFHVWLRRTLFGLSAQVDHAFKEPLAPKWDHGKNDGELIDDASRHGGDKVKSKAVYEDGMARAFQACHKVLNPEGKLVVVFANKQPDAWETLVSALIRAGFVVDGSWPIQTEMGNRTRALTGAALASSVWLVCRKRPATGRPGWDNQVLEEMRRNIREKLREFWDAGIRGPDFVWAATGPALETYSKHPVVKKANDPGQVMTVSEFLGHVRRMVVDYVVGRVMYRGDDAETRGRGDRGTGGHEGGETRGRGDAGTVTVSPGHRVAASQAESPIGDLDEPTAYYLLHRHDFGMDEAPAGACILYAISCGISDRELASTWDLIGFTKGKAAEDEEDAEMGGRGDAEMADEEADPDVEEDSGSKVKLKTWAQRKGSTLGYEAPSGRPVPLIDRVHCLMHLWKAGDLHKVDEYLDGNGLRRQELFKRLLQSLIELSPRGSEERSLLESISNHIGAKGAAPEKAPELPLAAEGNDAATR